MKLLAIILTVALGILAGAVSVWASNHTLADYDYSMTVAIDNQSGGALANTPIAINMNPSSLISGGFLQADAEDWRPVDGGEAALNGVAQGMASTSATWWIDVTQADGNLSTYAFHMGNNTATRDQGFRFDGTTDTITTADHADLDITNNLTLSVTTTLVAWPSSGTFISKSGAYAVGAQLNGATEEFFCTLTLAGAGAITLTADSDDNSDPLEAGTEYNVVCSMEAGPPNDRPRLFVNGVLSDSELHTDNIVSNASTVILGASVNGYLAMARVGHTSIASPTWVLQYDFEPDDLVETQQGNSGNSWTWLGMVEDVSAGGSDHDGDYSLTRDMTGITRWTYDLVSKSVVVIPPPATGVDLLGVADVNPVATQVPINFLGREFLSDVLDNPNLGIAAVAAWFIILTAVGLGLAFVVWKGTKSGILTAIPLPAMYWLGFAAGTPIALWIPILMSLVAIGAALGLKQLEA